MENICNNLFSCKVTCDFCLFILFMPANWENSAVAIGLEKAAFILIPKNDNAKECSEYCTIALISHASKVMLKILQARLQLYVN